MKTIALEVAEQLAAILGPPAPGIPWQTPDWYVQAVSGGMGPMGFWKGYQELYRMGLVNRLPKLALIQAEGCAPMVESHRRGLQRAEPVLHPNTRLTTITTGDPGKAYESLHRIVTQHGGAFEAVSDQERFGALHMLAKIEGLSVEPAAAAAFAGLRKLLDNDVIKRKETIVVNCSGHTCPVEKRLLDDEWVKVLDTSEPLTPFRGENALPKPIAMNHSAKEATPGGILGALDQLDRLLQRIAIIEDNPDAARLLRRILQTRGGFQISEAHTGQSGMEMIRAERPDLVLLDLVCPT